jgi:hypothetical protein
MIFQHGIYAGLGATPVILPLDADTIAYKNRVEADGGEVIDINYLNSEVIRLKNTFNTSGVSMYDRVHIYVCADFGIKRNPTTQKTEKIYDLKRVLMDLNQPNTNYQGVFGQAPNGSNAILLDGIDDYYESVIDNAMIQPLTHWYNMRSFASAQEPYIFDGRTSYDYCRMNYAFTAYAGNHLGAVPGISKPNTHRIMVRFDGANSVNSVNGEEITGDSGPNPMLGLTIGKPADYTTGTTYNSNQYFHSSLILAGVPEDEEVTSTNNVYTAKYI